MIKLIFVIIGFIAGVFFCLFGVGMLVGFSVDDAKIFNALCSGFSGIILGCAAIMTAVGGINFGKNYLEKSQNRINKLRKLYPRGNMKKDNDNGFFLCYRPGTGHVYLIDKKPKTKMWIKSQETMRELNYQYEDVEIIKQDVFDSYTEIDPIN